jgi:glyoxylate utilization-related uncharacterized protein
MEENRYEYKEFITQIAEADTLVGPRKGHIKVDGYRFIKPSSMIPKIGLIGKGPSMHTWVTLQKIQPGGGLEEFCHKYDSEMPVFDKMFYVISGRIRATVGDIEKTVGADTLIYCPSNVKHSITNVGKGIAKVLTIIGFGEGQTI